MDDEIRINVQLPLDADGFLRRRCPTCGREFKWSSHQEGDRDAEHVDQYFCPLCGEPAPIDDWSTDAQSDAFHELGQAAAAQYVQDAMRDAFRGSKHIKYKPGTAPAEPTPPDELLHEPNDMTIVEPPCHPGEPLKVPDGALNDLHCLLCGERFAVQ